MPAPITVLRDEGTPFAAYLGEVLYTEGLPWFDTAASWGEVGERVGRSSVLLVPHGAEVDWAAADAWLETGGVVALMRPPRPVLEGVGIGCRKETGAELQLTLASPFDCGTARAHGEVDLYELTNADAAIHAEVHHHSDPHPAVVSLPRGRGHLVLFAYDLPRSVALTRQGNPEWTDGRGTDFGSNTFRPVDLFVRGCGEQTWLDLPSAGAPAADMQQRLLARLLCTLSPVPLPRLWYLPNGASTALTILGDSDAADPEVVEAQFDDVASFGGTMSAFLIDYTVDRTETETAARWRAAGHEVSIHPDYHQHGDASKPDCATMLATEKTLLDRFVARFGFAPRTVRNHSVSWVGFAEQPKLEGSLGFRLNSSYVYSSAFAAPPYNGPLVGYLNGSGQPQKFAEADGRVLDLYQLGAHVCDEMLKSEYAGASADGAWLATEKLLDESRRRWHSFLGLSFHPTTYHRNPEAKRWLGDFILPYARAHTLPIMSAEKVLDFAEARRNCRLDGVEWDGSELRATVRVPADAAGLTMAAPQRAGDLCLTRTCVGRHEPADEDAPSAGGSPLVALHPGRTDVVARYER